MAEEESLNNSNEQGAAEENSLDDLLASASDLAGDLSEGVGGLSEEDFGIDSSGSDAGDGDESIEEQLENVEDLLGNASQELGSESESAPAPEADTKTTISWPPKDGDEQPAPAESAPAESQPDFSSSDSFDGDLNDLNFDDASIPTFDEEESAGGGGATSSSAAVSANIFEDTGPGIRWQGIKGLHLTVVDVFVVLLDWIDRPFMKVSYANRQVLGYCAVLTFLSAVVAFFLAVLM